MRSVSLPPWGLALVIAAGAPFVVRLVGESLGKRKRAKTESFLSRARNRTASSRVQGGASSGADARRESQSRVVAEARDPSGTE